MSLDFFDLNTLEQPCTRPIPLRSLKPFKEVTPGHKLHQLHPTDNSVPIDIPQHPCTGGFFAAEIEAYTRFQDITWSLIPEDAEWANVMGFNVMCRRGFCLASDTSDIRDLLGCQAKSVAILRKPVSWEVKQKAADFWGETDGLKSTQECRCWPWQLPCGNHFEYVRHARIHRPPEGIEWAGLRLRAFQTIRYCTKF
jgi:hypothetical protein